MYTPRPGVPPDGRHTRPGGISITYIYMTRVLENIKLPPPLNFTFNWDVDDVGDVDVVDDDADDDDVDEMREQIVIRLPKRTTRGISQNIGPAQSKRTFPGSTSVLAVCIYIYIFVYEVYL